LKQPKPFIGECECGYRHVFDKYDFDLSDEEEDGLRLSEKFICPECSRLYDILSSRISRRSKNMLNIVMVSVFVVPFFSLIIFALIPDDSAPTFKDTGDVEDMTNEEKELFKEWKKNKEEE